MFSKNSIFATMLLTVIWVILRESTSLSTIAIGMAVGFLSVLTCRKLIPLPVTPRVNFLGLLLYLVFLFGQVYVAGFYAVKLILTDADTEIVEVKTKISSLFFRTILVNSVTLVPGSIALDLKDNRITVLWLREKSKNREPAENADEILLGKFERMLIKAER